MQPIIFRENINTNNTHFQDFLTITNMTFQEIVARLYAISNQKIFENSDEYKTSFEISGLYEGNIFTLYDYKCDFKIHIGGHDNLDIFDLKKDLTTLILNTEPKPYVAKLYYDRDDVYSFGAN